MEDKNLETKEINLATRKFLEKMLKGEEALIYRKILGYNVKLYGIVLENQFRLISGEKLLKTHYVLSQLNYWKKQWERFS